MSLNKASVKALMERFTQANVVIVSGFFSQSWLPRADCLQRVKRAPESTNPCKRPVA